ncbi:transposon Tf2-9 polyprotein [Trichonephila clavipes]|nr:transposon Tf2-9 polyprotein [Trichonephila clavipes]
MANNEQTNLTVISTTNQTPNEPYIVPFDSENGMLIEAWLNYFNNTCYEIKEGCITPDDQNIETIKKLQPPKNVKQLQSFLGSVNVYNKFIDSYAHIREPLNQLLKKDKQWDWTAECQTAFELLKNKLITKPVLQLDDPKLPVHVFCDAFLNVIGATLKQPDNSGTLHPVSYHSRTLRDYEKKLLYHRIEMFGHIR